MSRTAAKVEQVATELTGPATPKRSHKATYATDKKKGGYLVRVAGPHAPDFAGREVPVTRRDGTEGLEMLEKVIWTGKDQESGETVALYKFASKPRDMDEIVF